MRRDSKGQGRPGRARAADTKRKEGFKKWGVGHTMMFKGGRKGRYALGLATQRSGGTLASPVSTNWWVQGSQIAGVKE